MGKSAELLPGTLDMLILKAVSLKPLHGYGILPVSYTHLTLPTILRV